MRRIVIVTNEYPVFVSKGEEVSKEFKDRENLSAFMKYVRRKRENEKEIYSGNIRLFIICFPLARPFIISRSLGFEYSLASQHTTVPDIFDYIIEEKEFLQIVSDVSKYCVKSVQQRVLKEVCE